MRNAPVAYIIHLHKARKAANPTHTDVAMKIADVDTLIKCHEELIEALKANKDLITNHLGEVIEGRVKIDLKRV